MPASYPAVLNQMAGAIMCGKCRRPPTTVNMVRAGATTKFFVSCHGKADSCTVDDQFLADGGKMISAVAFQNQR